MNNKFLEKSYFLALRKLDYEIEDLLFCTYDMTYTNYLIIKVKFDNIYIYHKILTPIEMEFESSLELLCIALDKAFLDLTEALDSKILWNDFAAKQLDNLFTLEHRELIYIYDSFLILAEALLPNYHCLKDFLNDIDNIDLSNTRWSSYD